MKRLIILILLFAIKANCQKNFFEFSLGNVNNKTFNVNVPSLGILLPAPEIDNSIGIFLSAGYERSLNSHFSLIVKVRNVSRKINYYYFNTRIDGFIHNIIEVPIVLRIKKDLNEQYKIFFDLSPGINYILTKDNITKTDVTSDISATADRSNKFQFVKSTKLNYFAQVRINLMSRISENRSILFFLSYQYQFTELFRYRTYNNSYDLYGNPLKPSYFSLGLSYRLSCNSKNKIHN